MTVRHINAEELLNKLLKLKADNQLQGKEILIEIGEVFHSIPNEDFYISTNYIIIPGILNNS